MPDDETDAETYRITLPEETEYALEDLFPSALDTTEAIRMAVDEAVHRRRADRNE
jgi:hypothetical protein